MIVAGTVASFDAEGFKQSFATALQVAPRDITLRVEAASVRVNANVTVAAAGPTAVATATQRVMNSLAVLRADPSAASAMLGVTLESMEPPVLHLTKCAAHPTSRPTFVPPPLLLSPLQCDSHPAWHWRTFARLACVCAQCPIFDDVAKLAAKLAAKLDAARGEPCGAYPDWSPRACRFDPELLILDSHA